MRMCPKHKLRPSVEGCSRCRQCIDQLSALRARRKTAGLCRCGKIPDAGYVLCTRCQKQLTERQRRARASGFCSCGKPRVEGGQCCRVCLGKASASRRKFISSGLCYCGRRSPAKGKKQCQQCIDLVRVRKMERREEGLCMCGKPLVKNLTKCRLCLKRESLRRIERLRTDEIYAVTRRIRICISGAFTRKAGVKRTTRTETLLGCSISHAKKHIEENFEPGMSWENHGKWHIDHHIPCSAFDLTDERQQRLCNNWRNLRPLWKKENRSKWDSLPSDYTVRRAELEFYVPHLELLNDPLFQ